MYWEIQGFPHDVTTHDVVSGGMTSSQTKLQGQAGVICLTPMIGDCCHSLSGHIGYLRPCTPALLCIDISCGIRPAGDWKYLPVPGRPRLHVAPASGDGPRVQLAIVAHTTALDLLAWKSLYDHLLACALVQTVIAPILSIDLLYTVYQANSTGGVLFYCDYYIITAWFNPE